MRRKVFLFRLTQHYGTFYRVGNLNLFLLTEPCSLSIRLLPVHSTGKGFADGFSFFASERRQRVSLSLSAASLFAWREGVTVRPEKEMSNLTNEPDKKSSYPTPVSPAKIYDRPERKGPSAAVWALLLLIVLILAFFIYKAFVH